MKSTNVFEAPRQILCEGCFLFEEEQTVADTILQQEEISYIRVNPRKEGAEVVKALSINKFPTLVTVTQTGMCYYRYFELTGGN